MDRARHEVVLRAVERQLEQLLDETAAGIGHEMHSYRSLIWEAKAAVKAASAQLGRLP